MQAPSSTAKQEKVQEKIIKILCLSCQKTSDIKLDYWQTKKDVRCALCNKKEAIIIVNKD